MLVDFVSLLRVDIAVQNLTGGHIITSLSAYNGIEASGVVLINLIFSISIAGNKSICAIVIVTQEQKLPSRQ